MALAIGLNAKIKLKTSLRGVFFIPMVISGIVIAYVFNFLFSTSIPDHRDEPGHRPAGEQHPRQREVRLGRDRDRHRLAGRVRER